MKKDKANLYEDCLKESPKRINSAIVNLTKSMNEAAKARYVAFDGGMGYHVVFSDGDLGYTLDSDIRELESPEQKLERQRLESAYHLACIAGGVDRWGDEFTFDNFKSDWEAVKRWLAVVDETKYLRGEK